MNIFVAAVSAALIAFGLLIVVRAESASAALSKFYASYPLVRLAGARQMKVRKGYMVAVGAVSVVVGVVALAATVI